MTPSIAAGSRALSPLLTDAIRHLGEAGVSNPRSEAELMMAAALDITREKLITHAPVISAEVASTFHDMIVRRARRIPLQYITGRTCFYSMEFRVRPGVFIPRPETELLVDHAIRHMKGRNGWMIDVGTGSGCIAVACAVHIPHVKILAIDCSPEALEVAGHNARRHGVQDRIHFLRGDHLEALFPRNSFELILSNPPYIGEDEFANLQEEVHFEPHAALVAGDRGLSFHDTLLNHARRNLSSGGVLLLEVGYNQAHDVRRRASAYGYPSIELVQDLSGFDRIVKALWK